MDSFQGRTAVITGAASGIGLALGRRLAAEGARVVLSDVQQGPLDAAVEAIRRAGGDAIGVCTDVAVAAAVAALASKACDAYGAPHLLFANAGVVTHGSIWQQSLDDWRWTLGVNLWGVVHCLRAFLPMMLERQSPGHVVITSSSAGLAGTSSSAYTASKFALVGIAEGLAQELAGTKVGVSVLCPGGVRTGILESEQLRPHELSERGFIAPQVAQKIAALSATGRSDRVEPELVADLVLRAISAGTLYVLPMQARYKEAISARLREVQAGLDGSPTTG